MELVEDKHSNDLDIKKYSNKTIFISDMTYTEPIVIHQNSISIFNISDPLLITIDELKIYLTDVDLILIGTGKKNVLLNQKLLKSIHDNNKGLEFMNTKSACKTHNLLLSEKRSFTSILYP